MSKSPAVFTFPLLAAFLLINGALAVLSTYTWTSDSDWNSTGAYFANTTAASAIRS